jgi:hypothetical protein
MTTSEIENTIATRESTELAASDEKVAPLLGLIIHASGRLRFVIK